jgi:hypothetical protein
MCTFEVRICSCKVAVRGRQASKDTRAFVTLLSDLNVLELLSVRPLCDSGHMLQL